MKEEIVSASDRAEAGMDKVKGSTKEAVGKMTDNERLEAEGKADKAKGHVKDAVEDAKDAFKDVTRD